jgi:polar amino acid transport system substrate-binding protein
VIVLATIVVVAALAGCQPDQDRAWQRARSSGVLRVGLDASYPPFEYVDEDNQIVGFDVDLAREIGARLELEIVLVNIAYDGLYDSLATQQADVLISAILPGYDDEGRADFSAPYFNAGEHLVVPSGSPVHGMADLEGRTLAVEYGSGGDVEARRWERRLARLSVIRLATPDAALAALLDGSADAAVVDGISARLGVGADPRLVIVESVSDDLFVIAVPQGSRALLDQINTTLDDLLAEGFVDQLIEEWFGPQGSG